MRPSFLSLGSLFGIPIRLHVSILYLALFAAVLRGPEMGLVAFLLVAVVLCHELGHGLVAQRLGVKVLNITLHAGGGFAQMNVEPEQPKQELIIALAGPLANLALAIPGMLGLLAMGEPIFSQPQDTMLGAVLWLWVEFHVLIGLFNLLPAFPMDGGRVLRSLLVAKCGYLEATEIAVRVGRYLALGMFITGFFVDGLFLAFAFISLFIWFMGGRELLMVRMRHMGGGASPFGRMFQFGGQTGSAGGNPFEDLFRQAQGGQGFGEARGQDQTHDTGRDSGTIKIDAVPGNEGAGFSEEEIKRLEGHHGRLRRPDGPE